MKSFDSEVARKELNNRVPFTPRHKARILNDFNRNPKRKNTPFKQYYLSINFRYSIAVLATIVLFGIISSSYYFQKKESNTESLNPSWFKDQNNRKGDVLTKNDHPDKEIPAPSGENTYDINELLTTYPYYQELYQSMSKAINSDKGAEVYILYLHALKQKDIEEIKKYSFATRESVIEALIEHYYKINYETLMIDKTIPSKAEPSFEVQLSYQLSGSKNIEKRTIHIHLIDEVTVNIYEPENLQN
ncbi:hypothetical protein A8F94_15845 [Bacillus sp. FJAT-27225]|uniref:hypothetical protein n=1 Tax=Bacillus sp. FJAT-27225 TaxID=1743144 RepID=UPI00080C2367|nr:hypothetical protein [Bacillus sp. FJAT-27225]OCA84190.1 hypothetical protein A8F94_15845 [Bacillus sp. FJAT-27225]